MIQHIFYQAICYLPFSIILFWFVLIAPAVAFFPILLRHPLLATAIPTVSILIVNCIALILMQFHLYSSVTVWSIASLFTLFAITRGWKFLRTQSSEWEKPDKYFYLLNFSILLPLIAMSGISAFMSNDALASWNYWAVIYKNGMTPYMGGYPPFFSLFISYCYQLLGNTEYQGAVKVLLIVFPWTMMSAIAFSQRKMQTHIFFYLALISICVFPGFLSLSFYSFYAIGYADPMLASSVAISLALILHYVNKPAQKEYLFFAVLCGIVAGLSKQPGLLWGLLVLPTLILFHWYPQRKNTAFIFFNLVILLLPILMWLLGQGAHFYQNQGVIAASLQSKPLSVMNLLFTFSRSIKNYLLLQPGLLVLILSCGYLACYHRQHKIIFFTLLLPGFILWFTLGAYDMRLGLYLLAAAGVLAASHPIAFLSLSLRTTSIVLLILGVALFAVLSVTEQINPHVNIPYRIYSLEAGRSNIYHYFGKQSGFVYNEIYNQPNMPIYAPTRIIAGIFYGHNPLIPFVGNDPQAIYHMIKSKHPKYVFAAFCDRQSEECLAMREVNRLHPTLLQAIPLGPTRYEYELYAVNNKEV